MKANYTKNHTKISLYVEKPLCEQLLKKMEREGFGKQELPAFIRHLIKQSINELNNHIKEDNK